MALAADYPDYPEFELPGGYPAEDPRLTKWLRDSYVVPDGAHWTIDTRSDTASPNPKWLKDFEYPVEPQKLIWPPVDVDTEDTMSDVYLEPEPDDLDAEDEALAHPESYRLRELKRLLEEDSKLLDEAVRRVRVGPPRPAIAPAIAPLGPLGRVPSGRLPERVHGPFVTATPVLNTAVFSERFRTVAGSNSSGPIFQTDVADSSTGWQYGCNSSAWKTA